MKLLWTVFGATSLAHDTHGAVPSAVRISYWPSFSRGGDPARRQSAEI